MTTKAADALHKVHTLPDIKRTLDVGAGPKDNWHDLPGDEVVRVDTNKSYRPHHTDIKQAPGDYNLIWCSHVLEHVPNVGQFLSDLYWVSAEYCWLAITVPPMKTALVGGHLTLWTPQHLLYNLVAWGLDCSGASVKVYGYNISVVVQIKQRPVIDLKNDNGDIETLAKYFPMKVRQGWDEKLEEINWK